MRKELNLFTCFKCTGNFCHVTLFRTHSSISVLIFPLNDFCIVSNEYIDSCVLHKVSNVLVVIPVFCTTNSLSASEIIKCTNSTKIVSWSKWAVNQKHQKKTCKRATRMYVFILLLLFSLFFFLFTLNQSPQNHTHCL